MIFVNTDLDGVPASGISIKDIHHNIFIPKVTDFDPALPSGSLWLRPYDGQMEMLTYQGTSGIFEVLNGQGYSCYGSASQFALSDSVPVIVEFGFHLIQDDQFISANIIGTIDDFTVHVDGLYHITYNLNARIAGGGGNPDGACQSRILVNGSELTGSVTRTYIGPLGDSSMVATVVASLNRGDVIEFEMEVISGGSNDMFYTGNSTFELIRPE